MMKFHYLGIDISNAEQIEGEIDAVNKADAINTLNARQIEVLDLTESRTNQAPDKKVSVKDLMLPLKELATLTGSGVSLLEALNAMAKNKEHGGLARGFKKLASLIEGGESLSSAIQQSKMPFPDYVHFLVHAGELSGELADALANASSQLEYELSIKNEIKSAVTYPLVLILSGLVAILIIFFGVVPKFAHMLDSSKELPTLAWLVLSAGNIANENTVLVFSILFTIVASLLLTFSNPAVRHSMMNGALKLPILGVWLAEQDSARWASLCGAMLNAKVELITALKLAGSATQYTSRKHRALSLINDVQSGISLTESIERSNLLPETSLNLISVGEKTGQLDKMFLAVAKLHDDSSKRRMKQILILIEPLAILIVGAVIGIMILGIVLAITASTDIAI